MFVTSNPLSQHSLCRFSLVTLLCLSRYLTHRFLNHFDPEPLGAVSGTEVKLVGGANATQGRVVLTRNGVDGTVCDDRWDDSDAKVICRMLGVRYVSY